MVKKGYKQTEVGVIPEKWKAKKLGDVGKVCMCKRIFANQTSNTGEVPFFKIGTFGKEADAYISKGLYEDYKQRFSYPQKGYAFGKTIRVKTMTAFVSKNWIQTLVSIYANRSSGSEQQKFILSSEDEMLVISLRDALLAKKKASPRASPPTVIQYEDNSVHIGDGNKISNSAIGSKNTIETECEISNPAPEKEKVVSKLFWKILVPIAVVVIGALVCIWFGIDT